MQLQLYKYTGKSNVIYKTLGSPKSITGVLRGETSLLNPVIEVEGSLSDLSLFNYALIQDFNRYYFITEKTSVSNTIRRLSLRCDVLSSFPSSACNAVGRRERSNRVFNAKLTDNLCSMEVTPKTSYYSMDSNDNMPDGFSTDAFNPFKNAGKTCVVLTPVKEMSLNYSFSYTPDLASEIPESLANIVRNNNSVFAPSIKPAFIVASAVVQTDVSTIIGDIYANPKTLANAEKDIKIRHYPFERGNASDGWEADWSPSTHDNKIPYLSEKYAIKTTGFKPTSYVGITGTTLTIDLKKMKAKYGNELWRINVDKYSLWIPFVGWFDIPSEELLNHIDESTYTIDTYYIVDPYTGYRYVYVYNTEHEILLNFTETAVAESVPLSVDNLTENANAVTQGAISTATKGVTSALGVVASLLARSNPGTAGMGILGLISSATTGASGVAQSAIDLSQIKDSINFNITKSNSYYYTYNNFVLRIVTNTPVEDFQDRKDNVGLPCNKYTSIAEVYGNKVLVPEIKQFGGFYMLSNARVPYSEGRTSTDNASLVNMLSQGVFLS